MAMSAVVTLNPTTASPNEQVSASVEITNSGASDVTLTGGRPTASVSGTKNESVSVNCGMLPITSGADLTVPASDTLTISFGVVCFKPEPTGESSDYDIGCILEFSDGSYIQATVDTLTIEGNAEESEG
jgi:hypothetical protein